MKLDESVKRFKIFIHYTLSSNPLVHFFLWSWILGNVIVYWLTEVIGHDYSGKPAVMGLPLLRQAVEIVIRLTYAAFDVVNAISKFLLFLFTS